MDPLPTGVCTSASCQGCLGQSTTSCCRPGNRAPVCLWEWCWLSPNSPYQFVPVPWWRHHTCHPPTWTTATSWDSLSGGGGLVEAVVPRSAQLSLATIPFSQYLWCTEPRQRTPRRRHHHCWRRGQRVVFQKITGVVAWLTCGGGLPRIEVQLLATATRLSEYANAWGKTTSTTGLRETRDHLHSQGVNNVKGTACSNTQDPRPREFVACCPTKFRFRETKRRKRRATYEQAAAAAEAARTVARVPVLVLVSAQHQDPDQNLS
mmetsp:Transcript_3213/g.9317  ORF Transcript_3213/g.9317 Transcript_3213/m.9317 type:complete len:263 (+) Transcript_3213:285-1073(+)